MTALPLTLFLACFVGDGYPAGVADTCRDMLFETDTVIECPGTDEPIDANPNGIGRGNALFLSTQVSGEREVLFQTPIDARGISAAPRPVRVNFVLNVDQADLVFADGDEPCTCHTRVSNGCAGL